MALKLAPKSVFVTGSNRGIGLEFIKQLSELPNPPKHIFAACRNPAAAKELQRFASEQPSVHVLELDVTKYEQYNDVVSTIQSTVGADGLNLLINNAGLLKRESNTLDTVTPEAMREHFEINSVAPVMLAKACLPLLTTAAGNGGDNNLSCSRSAIMNITSKVGSVADNKSGTRYAYRSSKAALNMITKSLSVDLKESGILAAVLHPGWVKTDMGGANALIDVQTSVSGLLKVMDGLDASKTGTFWDYKGEEIPW